LASCDTLLLRLDPTLVEAFYKLGLDDPVLTTLLQDVDSAERIAISVTRFFISIGRTTFESNDFDGGTRETRN